MRLLLNTYVESYATLQLIVLGGHNGSAWLENVTTHRPLTKHWGRLATLDGARSFAAAETWRDHVFIMGGGDGTQWFNSVLRSLHLTRLPLVIHPLIPLFS